MVVSVACHGALMIKKVHHAEQRMIFALFGSISYLPQSTLASELTSGKRTTMRTHTKHIGVHTDTREQSNVRQFLFTTFTTKGERLYHPHFFRKREKVFLLLHHPEYKASKQSKHSIA